MTEAVRESSLSYAENIGQCGSVAGGDYCYQSAPLPAMLGKPVCAINPPSATMVVPFT